MLSQFRSVLEYTCFEIDCMNEIDKNNNTFFSATLCHVIIGVNRILIRLYRRMKRGGGGQGSGRCVRGWVEGPPIILGGGGAEQHSLWTSPHPIIYPAISV